MTKKPHLKSVPKDYEDDPWFEGLDVEDMQEEAKDWFLPAMLGVLIAALIIALIVGVSALGAVL